MTTRDDHDAGQRARLGRTVQTRPAERAHPRRLAAARAAGARSGRRPQVKQLGVFDEVRAGFRAGTSVAALACTHHVSRVAIRTAVADLLPGRPTPAGSTSDTTELTEQVLVRIEVPGKIAHRLHALRDLSEAERHAVTQGRAVRRGQGYSLHITATPRTHQALLRAVDDLVEQTPADRKAYRIYRDRLTAAGVPTRNQSA
jgi:hypothetical protein